MTRPSAPRAFALVLLASLAAACGTVQEITPDPDASPSVFPGRVPGRTEVVVLGTFHERHLNSTGYSLDLIADFVRAVDPDVVLVEVPPDRFDAAVEEIDALGDTASAETITDTWVSAFPEIYGVVVPLRQELGYVVEPVSGWTEQVGADRDAYYDRFSRGPPQQEYVLAGAQLHIGQIENNAWDDPYWTNGPDYLELSMLERRWLSYFAEEDLGEAGPMHINTAHMELISDAIDRHAGERILIVFGAQHRWFIEAAVDAREDVTRISALEFLP